MHLWTNGWVYTGYQPGPAPGPVVIGDRDAPQDLRDAVQEFHSALRNGEAATAWEFVKPDADVAEAAVRTLVQDQPMRDLLMRELEILEFKRFADGVGANQPRIRSWRLRDIRTDIAGFAYLVTVAVWASSTSEEHVGVPAAEVDEAWVKRSSGWSVQWEGFPDPNAG